MLNQDEVDEFIEAAREVKRLKAALAAAEDVVKELKIPLLDAFVNSGTDSMKRSGVTVHTHSQGYAGSMVDPPAAAAALEAAGLADYVSPNSTKLSSLLREHGANDDAEAAIEAIGLPTGIIAFNVKHDLRVKGL